MTDAVAQRMWRRFTPAQRLTRFLVYLALVAAVVVSLQTVEVIPTKAPKSGAKRRLDAMLVRYQVDNKDTRPHQVGVKVWMDVYLVNNDGALFAAPNKPNKILDGVELKDSDVPDYL